MPSPPRAPRAPAAAQRKEDQELLGKALECMSLIGKAVGKERFGPDALAMMDALARIPLEEDSGDDALRGYMLQAWTRVCSTLGADFTPYLHLVMPLLFKVRRAGGGALAAPNRCSADAR